MEMKTYASGSAKVLKLSGSFDAYSSGPARAWFEEVTARPPARIIVNLEAVHFLDSTALSVLVQGMKRARQGGGDVRLCNMQRPVRMVFELTRLDRVFEIFNSEDDAIQAATDETIQV